MKLQFLLKLQITQHFCFSCIARVIKLGTSAVNVIPDIKTWRYSYRYSKTTAHFYCNNKSCQCQKIYTPAHIVFVNKRGTVHYNNIELGTNNILFHPRMARVNHIRYIYLLASNILSNNILLANTSYLCATVFRTIRTLSLTNIILW